MKIGIKKTVQADAKTLRLHIKVRDGFTGDITDQDGEPLCEFEDIYVPGFMPGDHDGDYLILDIDLDTGQITNWLRPSASQMEAFINHNREED